MMDQPAMSAWAEKVLKQLDRLEETKMGPHTQDMLDELIRRVSDSLDEITAAEPFDDERLNNAYHHPE